MHCANYPDPSSAFTTLQVSNISHDFFLTYLNVKLMLQYIHSKFSSISVYILFNSALLPQFKISQSHDFFYSSVIVTLWFWLVLVTLNNKSIKKKKTC